MEEHTFASDDTARETLTVPEVARVLGVSRNSAYAAIRRGELPSVRVGSRVVVPKPALRSLLAGGEPLSSPFPEPEGCEQR